MVSSLKAGFVLRENIFLCKALSSMACFLPFLLPMALLSSPLMPNIWQYAVTGFLEGPAFAFLLLNCVIATIIGSSKLQSERRELEAESQEYLVAGFVEEGDKMGKDGVDGNSMQQCFCLNTPLKHGHNHHKKKGEGLLRRCCSLNGSFDYQSKHEQVKAHYKKEKKLTGSRARLASRKTDKAGHFFSKPLGSEMQKRQLIRGSLTSFHTEADSDQGLHEEKPALAVSKFDTTADDHCTKGHSSTGHAVGLTDHQRQQSHSPPPAAAAEHKHPSMDEVWAAIMASRKNDDCCMASRMHAEKPGKKRNSKNAKQLLPATSTAAPSQAPAPLHTQPAAAATAATSRRSAAEPKPAGKALAKPGVRRVHVGNEEENGGDELKELNRRAEQFISRFNRQMRLQREESWQRQNRERRLLPLSL